MVFAGYGLVAPKAGEHKEYDSYVHLDVKDKWVIALRYVPEDVDSKVRQHLWRFLFITKHQLHVTVVLKGNYFREWPKLEG